MPTKEIDERFNMPTALHRWQRFYNRFRLFVQALATNVKNIPNSTLEFLSSLTNGQLQIPPEFMLKIESHLIGPRLTTDKTWTIPEAKGDGSYKCLAISVFVLCKVLVGEVLDNPETIMGYLGDLPDAEQANLHAYGMTLLALLTDLFFTMFNVEYFRLCPKQYFNWEIREHMFCDMQTYVAQSGEALTMSKMVGDATYKTFRFSKEREKEWNQLQTLLLQTLKTLNQRVALVQIKPTSGF